MQSQFHHPPHRNTQVVKTLWPPRPGTLKLARRFGNTLVCVRYRHDPLGLHRYTTVELIVDEAPVTSARVDRHVYGVKIGLHEHELRARAKAQGAKWDDAAKLWRLRGKAVKHLGLQARVREK
jgi:hypothetical protein